MVTVLITTLGRVIVGKKIKQKDNIITLEDPREFMLNPQDPKQVALLPYPPFAKSNIAKFNINNLVCLPYEADKQITDIYLQNVTGLVTATPQDLNKIKNGNDKTIKFSK